MAVLITMCSGVEMAGEMLPKVRRCGGARVRRYENSFALSCTKSILVPTHLRPPAPPKIPRTSAEHNEKALNHF